jgi:WD40 repeat protein
LGSIPAGCAPRQFAFRPDGSQVALAGKLDRSVHVFDMATGAKVARFDHPAATFKFGWRGDGRQLVVGCEDTAIYLWDVADPGRPRSVMRGHQRTGVAASFTRGGDLILSTSFDGTTRLWDPLRAQQVVRAPGRLLAASGDDRHVAVLRDAQIELWELACGRECRTIAHQAKMVDFAPDGRHFATAGQDVVTWDARDGREVYRLPTGRAEVALYQPGGASLLTSSQESGLLRWPLPPDAGTPSDRKSPGPPQDMHQAPESSYDLACWGDGGGGSPSPARNRTRSSSLTSSTRPT